MKEELLSEIRKEYQDKKNELYEYNKKALKIRELKKDKKVKEYIKLTGDNNKYKYVYKNDTEIMGEVYRKYLPLIKKDETNNIYFYIGTYSCYYHYDIHEGGVDKTVDFNDPLADYRFYWNIEGLIPIRVEKDKFKEFEDNNTIISTYYHSSKDYYYIQKEFFTAAANKNQEEAKMLLIKKYKI